MENKYYVAGYYLDWISGPYSLKEATKTQKESIEDEEPTIVLMEIIDEEGKAVK